MGARKGWVLSQEQNKGPKCWPEHMDDGSALRGQVGKSDTGSRGGGMHCQALMKTTDCYTFA